MFGVISFSSLPLDPWLPQSLLDPTYYTLLALAQALTCLGCLSFITATSVCGTLWYSLETYLNFLSSPKTEGSKEVLGKCRHSGTFATPRPPGSQV